MSTETPERERISDLIRSQRSKIVVLWEEKARQIPAARQLPSSALRNHLPQLLDAVAEMTRARQAGHRASFDELRGAHVLQRLAEGFDVESVLSEFAALREAILEVWQTEQGQAVALSEVRSLDSAMDEAEARSIAGFASARDRTLRREQDAKSQAEHAAAEQMRIGEQLRRNEQRLLLALQAAEAGLFDDDLTTGTMSWDDRAKAMYGVKPEVQMTYELKMRAVHPDDRERLASTLRDICEGRGGPDYALDYRTIGLDDGVERWLSARGRCFRDEHGKPARLLGTLQDITQRKRIEEELVRTAAFRDVFIGVLGHDLRTPLAAIHATAFMMSKRKDTPHRQVDELNRIMNSAERMGRMISDVLDFARGRLGSGFPLERARTNIHDVCGRVVDELQVANPERAMVFSASGDGWGSWDADRVAQVMSNLLSNAIQHGAPNTPIVVRLREQGEAVLLEVENQGRPIPRPLLPHIFDAFTGSAKTGKRLGLGLWIVREIARAHGGNVDVRSDDEATVFCVKWPRNCE